MPRDTSFFRELKAALKSLKGMVLEKYQKHLFDRRFDLVEELVLASYKVKFELNYFTSPTYC